ncbi:hypothetical protein [Variovorax ginsengisoli]|uniref:Restriction endonuclease type II-like domain-containing protein n=1 Tax=Variovorax ginsengisoli TaxID=363844 RepID=A0ABT9SCS5_9BURK|nr:hypothetical protein [Variovorax ginsengisoli]MDP9902158.1 hypothetical protein [Variovorax ginsengisoli]
MPHSDAIFWFCGMRSAAGHDRGATARDRDKLREQILRGLRWEIVRVWSTNWWIDSTGTLDRLDARLQALLTTQRERRTEEVEREAEAGRLAQAAIAQAMASTKLDEGTGLQSRMRTRSHRKYRR